MSNDKVQVAVRVRPFNRRGIVYKTYFPKWNIFAKVYYCSPLKEIDLNTKCVVEMVDSQTILHHPSTLDKPPER